MHLLRRRSLSQRIQDAACTLRIEASNWPNISWRAYLARGQGQQHALDRHKGPANDASQHLSLLVLHIVVLSGGCQAEPRQSPRSTGSQAGICCNTGEAFCETASLIEEPLDYRRCYLLMAFQLRIGSAS